MARASGFQFICDILVNDKQFNMVPAKGSYAVWMEDNHGSCIN